PRLPDCFLVTGCGSGERERGQYAAKLNLGSARENLNSSPSARSSSLQHVSCHPLTNKQKNEARIVLQISAGESSRFRDQAKNPFETVLHHPARCLRLRTCEKIEGGSHSKHHDRNTIAMIDDPCLLLRAPQPNEQPSRARC